MSGTSLDGLDLAYCEFRERSGSEGSGISCERNVNRRGCESIGECNRDENSKSDERSKERRSDRCSGDGGWDFEIKQADIKPYSAEWRSRLQNAPQMSGLELSLLNVDYGHYTGRCINEFIKENGLQPDFAAVHGHTVFHQPARGLTLQTGDGAAIAAECGLPVVCNFRTTDVALGGQGAPLVPIGDMLLFGNYDYCLNLGGIANISYKAVESDHKAATNNYAAAGSNNSGKCVAFDICICNMALNYLADREGLQYDKDGEIARTGSVNQDLLARMNALPFYSTPPPKSLGTEWFNEYFKPLFTQNVPVKDLLATTVEHIAIQITTVISNTTTLIKLQNSTMFITGGGALNIYLMERIKAHTLVQIAEAPKQLIDNKEALIFAFLGVLRMTNRPNALASVTGAKKDSIGGSIFLP
jgi:anhydro-N-acetylmuramic acid kinase